MWHVDERLLPPFQLILKMLRLGGRVGDNLTAYCTLNSLLLASSNVKGRTRSLSYNYQIRHCYALHQEFDRSRSIMDMWITG